MKPQKLLELNLVKDLKYNKPMDKLAERISAVLGSAWVIGGFGLWLLIHTAIGRDYISFISELAIEIGFLILRAENVAEKRNLKITKRIEKHVK